MSRYVINPGDSLEDILGWAPDMFELWNYLPLRRQPKSETKVTANGLKSLIGRPHNLSVSTNEKGEVTAYHIDLVYTPFPKSSIKMEIFDGVMTVSVGEGYKTPEEDKSSVNRTVYRGISVKPFTFSLYVKNFIDETEEIDTDKISASAEDGVLHLNFPIKQKAPAPQPKAVRVPLS